MTARSQNGWLANDRSVIRSYTIPGTTRKVALRMGDVAYVLLHFLAWFDKKIESIDGGELDDWGYAERNVRGSRAVSNHASGTAVDVNAPRHPMGSRRTFTPEQERQIRAKLKGYRGVIRWGGDYTGRPDEMHFEINAGPAEVKAMADHLRKASAAAAPKPKPKGDPVLQVGAQNHAVIRVQNALRKHGSKVAFKRGHFDHRMKQAVQAFQRAEGITPADGVVRQDTWDALRRKPRC